MLGGGEPPAARAASTSRRAAWTAPRKGELADAPARARRGGAAVLVATHDAEFAAAFAAARRAARPTGARSPTAPTAEVLAGGWYFATETARILGGAGGALTPEEGAELLRAPHDAWRSTP